MRSLVLTLSAICTIALLPLFLTLTHVIEGRFCTDALGQIIPLTLELKRMVASGEPFWTWNQLLGDNFIGSNGFYTTGNPFIWICALFPVRLLGIGVIISIYAMFVLNGVAAMLYFRRMGFSESLSRVGALMYALSSYCLLSFFFFTFPLLSILFPLLLTAIENMIDGRKHAWSWLALAAFACTFTNFYFGAVNLMLGAIYSLFRIFPIRDRRPLLLTLKGITAVFTGILMSCVILLPVVLCNIGTSRNITVNPLTLGPGLHLYIVMQKVCCICFPEIYENTGSPFFLGFNSSHLFMPVAGFAMAFAYVVRHPKTRLSLLLISLLFIYFTPLTYVFSFGASITYGRWVYAIVLMAIMATLRLVRAGDVKHYGLYALYYGAGIVAFCIIIALRALPSSYLLNARWEMISIALLVVSIILFGIFLAGPPDARRLSTLVIIMGTLMACLNGWGTRNELLPGKRDMIASDFYVNNPVEISDSREFTYRSDIFPRIVVQNHGCYCNIPSINSFHSVKNRALADFLRLQGVSDSPTFMIFQHRPSYAALLSVKYVLNDRELVPADSLFYYGNVTLDTTRSTPRVWTYVNNNYIPMGFCYDSYFPRERMDNVLNRCYPGCAPDVVRFMLENVVLNEADAKELRGIVKRADRVRFDAPLDSLAAERRKGHALNFRGTNRGFTATAPEADHARLMFFSVPADPGFTAYIDGNPTKIYTANLGMSAVVVPAGRHEIRFAYFTPGLKTGAMLSLAGWLLWLLSFVRVRRSGH